MVFNILKNEQNLHVSSQPQHSCSTVTTVEKKWKYHWLQCRTPFDWEFLWQSITAYWEWYWHTQTLVDKAYRIYITVSLQTRDEITPKNVNSLQNHTVLH